MSDTHLFNQTALKPEYWRYFARSAATDGDCPFYEHLALAIADDEVMQQFTTNASPGQPPANMLLAAVHYILLSGADHALRRYYSHLLKPGEAEVSIGPETYGVFCDFVAQHRTAIGALIAARVTNTNEVRRCTYLRAGYTEVAHRTGKPLHIIELGPSAGLNMNWDRYAYRYEHTDGRVLEGGPSSALTLSCEWRGEVPLPVPHQRPVVAQRIGLELNPVDLTDETDRRWLLATLWPGRPERIQRMKSAFDIALAYPPPIRPGDALAHLPEELEKVASEHTALVTHSFVTYQWNEPMWARLENILLEASRGREVHRVFVDVIARGGNPGRYPLRLRRYAGGVMVSEEELAEVNHHGAWIVWVKP